ncbi:hypothetical protein P3X46_030585 [Hevea brasiliensis]|uniref:Longin domain-containing protein n=1 Tax=Hevea brasiliensis TaxID=3981 RepID=A0ABQ9KHP0_HEVBR|nr:25.3 kDa vesicle transport protein SEC22-1 [Hevea brasiliensis]KAJ9139893.1 hypothetical protein P3X46_030585 [Hevea brasiliensis]
MVELTIIGRLADGLPLAQGPRYVHKENDNFIFYRQQAEFILKEISSGALTPSKMTIRIDHHSFNYLVENGVCFITLCDSSYPRKLAFHYLQDLQKELEKLDNALIHKITSPYTFHKFDGVIRNIRKQYVDTRTQANLSKLNASRQKDTDIITQHISEILERKRNAELSETALARPPTAPSIWGSPLLELIALKWTPITIVVAVASVLLWASLIFTEDFIISTI